MEEVSGYKIVAYCIGFVAIMIAFGWLLNANGLVQFKVFGPAWEGARREVYEQTKSYRDGSKQRLGNLCSQIASADDEHKSMLQTIVAQEFASWETTDIPAHLRACLTTARMGR